MVSTACNHVAQFLTTFNMISYAPHGNNVHTMGLAQGRPFTMGKEKRVRKAQAAEAAESTNQADVDFGSNSERQDELDLFFLDPPDITKMDPASQAEFLGVRISADPQAPNEVTEDDFQSLVTTYGKIESEQAIDFGLSSRESEESFLSALRSAMAAEPILRGVAEQLTRRDNPVDLELVEDDPQVILDSNMGKFDVGDLKALPPHSTAEQRNSQVTALAHVLQESMAMADLAELEGSSFPRDYYDPAHADALNVESTILAKLGIAEVVSRDLLPDGANPASLQTSFADGHTELIDVTNGGFKPVP